MSFENDMFITLFFSKIKVSRMLRLQTLAPLELPDFFSIFAFL